MSNNSDWVSEAAELRRRAQQLAREKAAKTANALSALSPEETRQLAYELQVHQIELEMQNDELRRTQGELETSRARYFDLYDLAPVGYLTLSDQGLILEANLTVSVLLDMARGDLVKMPLTRFILSEDRGTYYHHHEQLLHASPIQRCEVRMVKKDGSIFWAHLSLTTAIEKATMVLRVAISDITERKRADDAVVALSLRNEILLQMGSDGIHVLDERGNVIEANNAFCTMLGCSREEVLRANVKDWDVQWTAEELPLKIRQLMARPGVFETRHRTMDGRIRDVEINARGVMLEKEYYLYASARDISERKEAQAHREKLEVQNRQLQKSESLGRMAGAIAHHFNNQLQVVMMNLDFALRSKSSGEFPTENLTGAMQSARKAAEVSTLMLTYLGQTNADREPLDLAKACLRSLPMLQAKIPNGLLLETDIPSIGPVINGNVGHIQQVLVNLVANAWEASLAGRGVIRIAVKEVSAVDIPAMNRFPVDCHPQDLAYACLEVADEGCGISAQDIEKLFEPYFSTKFTGRGLGLPVVLGIVRAHQGVVTVESEPGRGSVFRVFLPVSSEAIPQKQVPVVQVPKTARGGTVLVVEDETTLRKVVTTAIKGMGFKILDAHDGVQAVEVFRQHQNDICLVVCDLTMPRMDGWETIEALRKLEPCISVILCSGYSEAQVMTGNHPEKPQAFLSKPYEYEQLSEAVFRVLNSKAEGIK